MSGSTDLLSESRVRAAQGEPVAQIALAWEHARGELIPKDLDAALALFREAERTEPQLARFNPAKAKFLNGDSTFRGELVADCEAGYGPSLYLMGVITLRSSPSESSRARSA